MRAIVVVVSAAALIALGGCGPSQDELNARWMAQIEADKQACQDYGFAPDQPEFGQCRLALRQIRAQESIAAQQMAAQAAIANQALGMSLYNQWAAPRAYAPAYPRNCQTYDAGGGVMRERCW